MKSIAPLEKMSITTRFALGIGLLLALIVTVALTGYLSIFFVRSADRAIGVSSEIRHMVLAMDRGMERARRLHADFHLQYPVIGLAAAHERYAQPSVRQIAKVIAISDDLQAIIDRSAVSEALRESRVDMNLYLSSARRFAVTSIQSVELVTELAASHRGLESQLDGHLNALAPLAASHGVASLYTQMRAHVQDYRISRKRHLMQSAFNTAFQIRNTITKSRNIPEDRIAAIEDLLDRFNTTAEEILAVDAAIKAKFNDFALQADAVAPISAALIELADREVGAAQARIARANTAAIAIMATIAIAGLVVGIFIARGLNNRITRRVVRLTAAAGEFRKGNLDTVAQDRGEDELSELARTFNLMAARIRELVNHLERKVEKRTQALVESEGRFRDLFEHSTSGVAVYRPVDNGKDFLFTDCNKAAETIEQIRREELIGKPVTEIFPAVEEFGLLDVFRKVASTGRPAHHPVSFYSDGRMQGWRENSVYRLPTGEIVTVFEDRTARKQAEEDKEALERQLQQARKMEAIGNLAGGIAHDFNNILSIILGNTELALGDIDRQHPAASYLNEIHLASLRARDVIRQLLSFSRKTEPKKEPIAVIPVIKESLSLMRASLPANIAIEQALSENCGAIVADPTQIHQVIINLCTNAAHAMESSGGVLRVAAGRIHPDQAGPDPTKALKSGPCLRLTVSDTGSGMEPEILHRIFDPYFTTKEVGKGSGMGLSVVHGIVEAHGGVIRVESQPGEGSTIEILLPAVDGEVSIAPDPPISVCGGKESVLLIDDEISLLTSTGAFLERLGYRVHCFEDPVAAMDAYRSSPRDYDLLIIDMTMPKITGVEFVRRIRPMRSDLPIILCSGYSNALDGKEAEEIGINRYVEKPVKLKELAVHIREVLKCDQQRDGLKPDQL